MDSHEDLLVWQKAIELVDLIYELTRCFPLDERFGLTSQMQRAAVSVPANIAEGAGRESTKDYLRFLAIAQGSLSELSTFFVIVGRRNYVSLEQLNHSKALSQEVGRLLTGLRRSLKRKLSE